MNFVDSSQEVSITQVKLWVSQNLKEEIWEILAFVKTHISKIFTVSLHPEFASHTFTGCNYSLYLPNFHHYRYL